ncbi:two-component sensor histidine kinase [Latilactobacillus curvatus]|uniref:two-component system histidine kinase PnpS n=1 Tax=Latilactobacillus curvatus TaxID=28038 RepID=UPI000FECB478|nr:ATP-binding protein [Latilactobacillus curvatus]MDG2978668.1 two-component sensor histidine kinase [Latilactobacillus curvatus]MDT3393920.1 two-component sensor histidine kinase [Bacillota bacterium]QAR35965.1 two-component sensor histidine kinase [Latilactobacillus curvatus]
MTKHDQFRFYQLATILVAIYIGFIVLVNLVIAQQQDAMLKERGADYALIIKQPQFDRQKWLRQNDLQVLTPKSPNKTKLQKAVTDIVNRNHSAANFSTRQTVNKQPYLFYAHQADRPNFVLVVPQQQFWHTWPKIALSVTIVYLIGSWIFLYRFWRQRRHFFDHLKILVANIHHIRHEEVPEPIIFQKDASLYILAQEINKLNGDMRHMRQKIAMQQGSFDRLIDHLPVGVMVINENREVVLHNEAMDRLLETTIVAEKHPYIDDIKTYELTRMIEHTFRYRKSHHQEIQLIQNQERFVDANVVQLNTVKSKFQALVILYDLTDVRRVEQMQLDFVSNVSHELKTPVTAITGFAETLLAGAAEDPATQKQFLQIIYDESTRLTALIQDILALSHLDRKDQSQEQLVNVRELVQANLELMQQKAQQKQLHVSVDIPTDLAIRIQKMKFNQILKNLIANAITYNKQNGSLVIAAQLEKDQIVIRVVDTGLGIPSDLQERIFERFYRVDQARATHKSGTGLGLAIASEITASLEGQLTVESQLGVGSEFILKLPNA